ncbi:MAG: sugar kinase [Pelomonas sp.]|nr:sugar kinase [Roseateles sp.]
MAVAVGECMIELSDAGAGLLRQAFGGDTLNTAVYLARLAGDAYRVGYATALGDADFYSAAMLEAWRTEGLDTTWVQRRAGELPGLYTIQVDAHGERRFAYWRNDSAARRYLSSDASPLLAREADIDLLYVSGISLAILPETDRARLLALMQRLHARGACVVFDNNYRPRLWPDAAVAQRAYADAYATASVALVTLDDEMALFPGSGGEDTALAQCRARCGDGTELVVKRGQADTLVARLPGEFQAVPTRRVERVVDTTAAGDSFAAGYLAARLHGQPPAVAAAAGNALAATVIQHRGAVIPAEAMPAALWP